MADSIRVAFNSDAVFDAILVLDPTTPGGGVRPYFDNETAAAVADAIQSVADVRFDYDSRFDFWSMIEQLDDRVSYLDFIDRPGGRVHGLGIDLVGWFLVGGEGEPEDPEPAP